MQGERTQLKLQVHLVNIREHSPDGFKGVDDSPYGGGPGMVMRPDVLETVLKKAILPAYPERTLEDLTGVCELIFTSPGGEIWNDKQARLFCSQYFSTVESADADYQDKDLIFLCGRYEGVDERFLQHYRARRFSIGDYVLSGGDLAVMAILDSALRFVPGTLGHESGALQDSFSDGLLEHPQYTRPPVFHAQEVPVVLMSGNHAEIATFRQRQRQELTRKYRPDLWQAYSEKNKGHKK